MLPYFNSVLDQKPLNLKYSQEIDEHTFEVGPENPYVDKEFSSRIESESENDGLENEWKTSGDEQEDIKADEESSGNESTQMLDSLLKTVFKMKEFRPGQREAIQKILIGESLVLLLPTGSGKSLCFQIPAYIFGQQGKLTILVSPTISLMEDQLSSLNSSIRGSMLNSNQTVRIILITFVNIRVGQGIYSGFGIIEKEGTRFINCIT
jgi:ATP-dependent helicase YprA (DUF1998 family)